MGNKHWVKRIQDLLRDSLGPIPHELNELDWKIGLSEQKERMTEHLIAFANHPDGGCFVFGVSDAGVPEGIDQQSVTKVVNTLANLGRDAIEPPLALDHAMVDVSGTQLLFVHTPEQSIKPVHKRGKSIEESWIRSGGTTRKASRQELGALMLQSSTPQWEELRASKLITLIDVLSSIDVDQIARLLQRPLPKAETELSDWLVEEGLVAAEGHGYYITNFGAIAGARRLDDFPSLERKRVRVVRYAGTNKLETIDEQPGHKGYAVGFEGLITYLTRILPHSEVIQQSLRTQVSLYPEIALRELIANALIHQDFSISGTGPMVEVFSDRIEITNPGTLLPGKRPDRLIGASPQSRNERLASSFRLYRICEERGTGFQKVVTQIELFGMPPLLFTPMENSFRVTLYAPRKFSDMDQSERVEACYQHAVLQYISSKTLTNTTLRERFKLHEKNRNQITNLISDSVHAGRIKRKDEGAGNKFAEYIPYWAS